MLVQVNLTDDPSAAGALPTASSGLAAELGDLGLDVQGSDGRRARSAHPRCPRRGFRTVRALADRLASPSARIGMSDDLEVARGRRGDHGPLGTALFGPRPPPR